MQSHAGDALQNVIDGVLEQFDRAAQVQITALRTTADKDEATHTSIAFRRQAFSLAAFSRRQQDAVLQALLLWRARQLQQHRAAHSEENGDASGEVNDDRTDALERGRVAVDIVFAHTILCVMGAVEDTHRDTLDDRDEILREDWQCPRTDLCEQLEAAALAFVCRAQHAAYRPTTDTRGRRPSASVETGAMATESQVRCLFDLWTSVLGRLSVHRLPPVVRRVMAEFEAIGALPTTGKVARAFQNMRNKLRRRSSQERVQQVAQHLVGNQHRHDGVRSSTSGDQAADSATAARLIECLRGVRLRFQGARELQASHDTLALLCAVFDRYRGNRVIKRAACATLTLLLYAVPVRRHAAHREQRRLHEQILDNSDALSFQEQRLALQEQEARQSGWTQWHQTTVALHARISKWSQKKRNFRAALPLLVSTVCAGERELFLAQFAALLKAALKMHKRVKTRDLLSDGSPSGRRTAVVSLLCYRRLLHVYLSHNADFQQATRHVLDGVLRQLFTDRAKKLQKLQRNRHFKYLKNRGVDNQEEEEEYLPHLQLDPAVFDATVALLLTLAHFTPLRQTALRQCANLLTLEEPIEGVPHVFTDVALTVLAVLCGHKSIDARSAPATTFRIDDNDDEEPVEDESEDEDEEEEPHSARAFDSIQSPSLSTKTEEDDLDLTDNNFDEIDFEDDFSESDDDEEGDNEEGALTQHTLRRIETHFGPSARTVFSDACEQVPRYTDAELAVDEQMWHTLQDALKRLFAPLSEYARKHSVLHDKPFERRDDDAVLRDRHYCRTSTLLAFLVDRLSPLRNAISNTPSAEWPFVQALAACAVHPSLALREAARQSATSLFSKCPDYPKMQFCTAYAALLLHRTSQGDTSQWTENFVALNRLLALCQAHSSSPSDEVFQALALFALCAGKAQVRQQALVALRHFEYLPLSKVLATVERHVSNRARRNGRFVSVLESENDAIDRCTQGSDTDLGMDMLGNLPEQDDEVFGDTARPLSFTALATCTSLSQSQAVWDDSDDNEGDWNAALGELLRACVFPTNSADLRATIGAVDSGSDKDYAGCSDDDEKCEHRIRTAERDSFTNALHHVATLLRVQVDAYLRVLHVAPLLANSPPAEVMREARANIRQLSLSAFGTCSTALCVLDDFGSGGAAGDVFASLAQLLLADDDTLLRLRRQIVKKRRGSKVQRFLRRFNAVDGIDETDKIDSGATRDLCAKVVTSVAFARTERLPALLAALAPFERRVFDMDPQKLHQSPTPPTESPVQEEDDKDEDASAPKKSKWRRRLRLLRRRRKQRTLQALRRALSQKKAATLRVHVTRLWTLLAAHLDNSLDRTECNDLTALREALRAGVGAAYCFLSLPGNELRADCLELRMRFCSLVSRLCRVDDALPLGARTRVLPRALRHALFECFLASCGYGSAAAAYNEKVRRRHARLVESVRDQVGQEHLRLALNRFVERLRAASLTAMTALLRGVDLDSNADNHGLTDEQRTVVHTWLRGVLVAPDANTRHVAVRAMLAMALAGVRHNPDRALRMWLRRCVVLGGHVSAEETAFARAAFLVFARVWARCCEGADMAHCAAAMFVLLRRLGRGDAMERRCATALVPMVSQRASTLIGVDWSDEKLHALLRSDARLRESVFAAAVAVSSRLAVRFDSSQTGCEEKKNAFVFALIEAAQVACDRDTLRLLVPWIATVDLPETNEERFGFTRDSFLTQLMVATREEGVVGEAWRALARRSDQNAEIIVRFVVQFLHQKGDAGLMTDDDDLALEVEQDVHIASSARACLHAARARRRTVLCELAHHVAAAAHEDSSGGKAAPLLRVLVCVACDAIADADVEIKSGEDEVLRGLSGHSVALLLHVGVVGVHLSLCRRLLSLLCDALVQLHKRQHLLRMMHQPNRPGHRRSSKQSDALMSALAAASSLSKKANWTSPHGVPCSRTDALVQSLVSAFGDVAPRVTEAWLSAASEWLSAQYANIDTTRGSDTDDSGHAGDSMVRTVLSVTGARGTCRSLRILRALLRLHCCVDSSRPVTPLSVPKFDAIVTFLSDCCNNTFGEDQCAEAVRAEALLTLTALHAHLEHCNDKSSAARQFVQRTFNAVTEALCGEKTLRPSVFVPVCALVRQVFAQASPLRLPPSTRILTRLFLHLATPATRDAATAVLAQLAPFLSDKRIVDNEDGSSATVTAWRVLRRDETRVVLAVVALLPALALFSGESFESTGERDNTRAVVAALDGVRSALDRSETHARQLQRLFTRFSALSSSALVEGVTRNLALWCTDIDEGETARAVLHVLILQLRDCAADDSKDKRGRRRRRRRRFGQYHLCALLALRHFLQHVSWHAPEWVDMVKQATQTFLRVHGSASVPRALFLSASLGLQVLVSAPSVPAEASEEIEKDETERAQFVSSASARVLTMRRHDTLRGRFFAHSVDDSADAVGQRRSRPESKLTVEQQPSAKKRRELLSASTQVQTQDREEQVERVERQQQQPQGLFAKSLADARRLLSLSSPTTTLPTKQLVAASSTDAPSSVSTESGSAGTPATRKQRIRRNSRATLRSIASDRTMRSVLTRKKTLTFRGGVPRRLVEQRRDEEGKENFQHAQLDKPAAPKRRRPTRSKSQESKSQPEEASSILKTCEDSTSRPSNGSQDGALAALPGATTSKRRNRAALLRRLRTTNLK